MTSEMATDAMKVKTEEAILKVEREAEVIEVPWWQKEYEKLKYIETATGVRYEHRIVNLVVFLMAALVISVIVWRGLCLWVGWLYWHNMIVPDPEVAYDSYVMWKV